MSLVWCTPISSSSFLFFFPFGVVNGRRQNRPSWCFPFSLMILWITNGRTSVDDIFLLLFHVLKLIYLLSRGVPIFVNIVCRWVSYKCQKESTFLPLISFESNKLKTKARRFRYERLCDILSKHIRMHITKTSLYSMKKNVTFLSRQWGLHLNST